MKKKLLFLILSFLFIGIFYYIYQKYPKNYAISYTIENYTIKELYDKSLKEYQFTIDDANDTYVYAVSNKYLSHRKLIKEISKEDNCLQLKSNYVDEFYICKENDTYVSRFYNETLANEKILLSKDNINFFTKISRPIFIWNYKNFIYAYDNTTLDISLFNKDFYSLDLVSKYKNYLIVADYDSDYSFDTFYLLNSQNGSIKMFNLTQYIYLDSYFLGYYKDYIYLYDVTKKQEYKINPLKKKIQKISNTILQDGEFTFISDNKLAKKTYTFDSINDENYFIKDDYLYYHLSVCDIKVTSQKVKEIIYVNDDICFYIAGDSLYEIKISDYLKKVASYSEWEFNYKNIYIF